MQYIFAYAVCKYVQEEVFARACRVGQNFKPDRQKANIPQKIQIIYGTLEPN